MKRGFFGAGALALALALGACGAPTSPAGNQPGAEQSTPLGGESAGSGASSGVSTAEATSGTTGGATAEATSGTTGGATGTATTRPTTGGTTGTATTRPTTGGATGTATTGTSTSGTGGASGATGGGSLADAATANPSISTLVSLLEASGLIETLEQAGPFTIFAPSNEAFAALPAGTLEALAQNPDLLQQILLNHAVQERITASDAATTASVTTLNGTELTIEAAGGDVTIDGTATVVEADIAAGQGVIHIIDQVLLPEGVELPSS